MPVAPLLCVIDGPTRGRPWASDAARAQLRRVAAKAGVRRPFAPHQLRHAHAVELAHEGSRKCHPAPTGAYQPRRHLHLSARDLQRRDHRDRPRPQSPDDPRQHRTPDLRGPAVAPELLASKTSTRHARPCCGYFTGRDRGGSGSRASASPGRDEDLAALEISDAAGSQRSPGASGVVLVEPFRHRKPCSSRLRRRWTRLSGPRPRRGC